MFKITRFTALAAFDNARMASFITGFYLGTNNIDVIGI
jgi:hypothetical protein